MLLFANNATSKHVAAFCDPGIMHGDVGVYSAHYKVSSSVHGEENMVGEPRITGNLCIKDRSVLPLTCNKFVGA